MRSGSIYAASASKETLYRDALSLYYSNRARGLLRETLAAAPTPLDGLAAYVCQLGQMTVGEMPSQACMLMRTMFETSESDEVLRDVAEEMLRRTGTAFVLPMSLGRPRTRARLLKTKIRTCWPRVFSPKSLGSAPMHKEATPRPASPVSPMRSPPISRRWRLSPRYKN